MLFSQCKLVSDSASSYSYNSSRKVTPILKNKLNIYSDKGLMCIWRCEVAQLRRTLVVPAPPLNLMGFFCKYAYICDVIKSSKVAPRKWHLSQPWIWQNHQSSQLQMVIASSYWTANWYCGTALHGCCFRLFVHFVIWCASSLSNSGVRKGWKRDNLLGNCRCWRCWQQF